MTCKIHVHFLNEEVAEFFPSIACNSMIMLDKQREEQSNLATN